jgi:hypothetical protein
MEWLCSDGLSLDKGMAPQVGTKSHFSLSQSQAMKEIKYGK